MNVVQHVVAVISWPILELDRECLALWRVERGPGGLNSRKRLPQWTQRIWAPALVSSQQPGNRRNRRSQGPVRRHPSTKGNARPTPKADPRSWLAGYVRVQGRWPRGGTAQSKKQYSQEIVRLPRHPDEFADQSRRSARG